MTTQGKVVIGHKKIASLIRLLTFEAATTMQEQTTKNQLGPMP